jgi:hypothetical protein
MQLYRAFARDMTTPPRLANLRAAIRTFMPDEIHLAWDRQRGRSNKNSWIDNVRWGKSSDHRGRKQRKQPGMIGCHAQTIVYWTLCFHTTNKSSNS